MCVFVLPADSVEELNELAGAQFVQHSNNKFEIYTKQPEAILAPLFRNEIELSDLEVVGAGLEEAFLALTDNGKQTA